MLYLLYVICYMLHVICYIHVNNFTGYFDYCNVVLQFKHFIKLQFVVHLKRYQAIKRYRC